MKKIIFLFLSISLTACLSAQTKIGSNQYLQFFGGVNVYSGEIGGSNTGIGFLDEWNLPDPRWQAGIGYKFAITNSLNFRMLAQYMRLAGYSLNLKDSREFSYVRSFESQLFEAGANLEYSFWNVVKSNQIFAQTYVFGGLGLMFGNKVDFKSVPPIEESMTNMINFNPNPAPYFTAGVGFHRNFSSVAIGIELWWQFMMSDFVDGIRYYDSQSYDCSAGISLIFSLRTKKQYDCFCEN
ncbi:MAG: hypothetical protein FWF72_06870 [Paludibacter sp.]|nr:hypothetical protein [Paludibacter sp.]